MLHPQQNLNRGSIDPEQILHYQQKLQYEIDPSDLHQALQNQQTIIVIDARSQEAYQNEHIPQAINFHHHAITTDSAQERLNFSTLYVTYCDGIGCNASTKAALKLAQLGYTVKELIGGIAWWKRDQYPIVSNKVCSANTADIHCGCD